MNTEKILPIIKGCIKHLPGVKHLIPKWTGGTISSRYCYSVWLRHLTFLYRTSVHFPQAIAELGPGDSLGIGLAALLSGCEKYYALDVVKYWDVKRNLTIFDELVELYSKRAPIPDEKEFPLVKPPLHRYDFPSHIIPESQLSQSLAPERVARIRQELEKMDSDNAVFIHYHIPWYDAKVIQKASIDYIFSQAVLEHVEDLENTYGAMYQWLKPFGIMTHQIDFKSHGITKSWNGHWTFSESEWKIVRGGKNFYINREPYTTHIKLCEKHGFRIVDKIFFTSATEIQKQHLSEKFRILSEEELTTNGIFIVGQKI